MFRQGEISRALRFLLWLTAAWVVMTTTHELGHVVGGWLGGGKLVTLEIAPWRLPHSLHRPDPHPRFTLWCGPILGVVVPLAVALATRHALAVFVADFAMLANGVYLALAWWAGDRFLDTPRMLSAGVHPLWIALFSIVTIGVGYVRFRADCVAMFSAGRH